MVGKRILELDVLRGAAILLVMGTHVPAYPIWSTFGGFGVDLFFVLSGFLISNLLFQEYKASGRIELARFFLRRALKLYPSFYLLLGLSVLYCVLKGIPLSAKQLFGEAIMAQNYLGSIWGHTWSLAVEEHFYLFLPLGLAFLVAKGNGRRDPFDSIPKVFAVVAALCLALRIGTAIWLPAFDHKVHYQPSHLRLDSLLFGVFLGYLHNFRSPVVRRIMSAPWRFPISLVSVLGLLPAIALPYTDPLVYTAGFTLLYVSFGTMLLLTLYPDPAARPAAPGRAQRMVAKMGVYSYTIYLWHVPMAQVFESISSKMPGVNPYLLHAVYFASSIAAGVVASKALEMPILRIRERLMPAAPALQESFRPVLHGSADRENDLIACPRVEKAL